MILSRKIKLSPNKQQKIVLTQMLHACKFIYNSTLYEVYETISDKVLITVKETFDHKLSYKQKEVSKGNEKYLRYFSKSLKDNEDFNFLNVLHSSSVQYVAKNVKSSINKVLERRKSKKKAKFRFKHSINEVKITFENANGKSLKIEQNGFSWAYMTKALQFVFPSITKKDAKLLSYINFSKTEKNFPEHIGDKFFISQDAFGQFFISFNYEFDSISSLGNTEFIGFDLGFTDIIVSSTGIKIPSQRLKSELLKKEAKLKRKLSKIQDNKICKIKNKITKKELKRIKKKNKKDKYLAKKKTCKSNLPVVDKFVYSSELFKSINSNKIKRLNKKTSKLPAKAANIVNDYNHKLANTVVSMISHVGCFEDLNLEGMKKLYGKRISELCLGDLMRKIEYKAKKEGKEIVKIGRFYPSTKLCSNCNHKISAIGLNERSWTCPECEMVRDRDINAALNIKEEGKRIKKGVPA